MYVTTFYSFKGGVGRTMALANVAVVLAQMGRRVLIVDFDLEAPGIDTLPLPKPVSDPAGVVDFISDYIDKNETPEIVNYVYEAAGVGRNGGHLFVMPAGKADDGYGQRLNAIDWPELYANRDGFLLIEDMKAQWQQAFAPDYVLIDSRTGHTDISGICTRQLPDAVVVLFIPNEQNLRGLEPIVRNVRHERKSFDKKGIGLLFVMSNVPDLDDEEDILAGKRRDFEKALGIEKNDLEIIYRYDSLALLNQTIFTQSHPKSRLAKEYVSLTQRLMRMNPEDREGALEFLHSLERRDTARRRAPDVEGQLLRIQQQFERDSEVLTLLANVRLSQGKVPDALRLLDEAISRGKPNLTLMVRRADLRALVGDYDGVESDVRDILNDKKADFYTVERVVRLLQQGQSRLLVRINEYPALQAQPPEAKIRIATTLRWNRSGLRAGVELLELAKRDYGLDGTLRRSINSDIAFNLVGLGEFERARATIRENNPVLEDAAVPELFNYSMATWAIDGEPNLDLLNLVVQRMSHVAVARDEPNHLQCLALAQYWVGNAAEALLAIHKARNAAVHNRSPLTSAWRYLMVTTDEFLADIQAIEQLIQGHRELPPFAMPVEAAPANA